MRIRQMVGLLLAVGTVFGGLGLSRVEAKKSSSALRISLAIPQLCNASESVLPRFLPMRSATERFPVVIENISDKPILIWAAGNSAGDYALTFEITGPDGKTTVVRPVQREYTKNIFRSVRLLPGEAYVRDVNYNATPSEWEGFPTLTEGQTYKATVRAVLTQTPTAISKGSELWTGKTVSQSQEILFRR